MPYHGFMPVEPRTVAVTFWLPAPLKKAVKRLAKETGKLEKVILTEAVQQYLNNPSKQ